MRAARRPHRGFRAKPGGIAVNFLYRTAAWQPCVRI